METVTFEMTACEASRGPDGSEELALEFRTAGPRADVAWLRKLRIGGVLPGALLALRVRTGMQVAFVLEASRDRVGRTVAAGDQMAAIYGPGPGGCLQVAAGDFLRPVAVSDAGVQLRLRGMPRTAIAALWSSMGSTGSDAHPAPRATCTAGSVCCGAPAGP